METVSKISLILTVLLVYNGVIDVILASQLECRSVYSERNATFQLQLQHQNESPKETGSESSTTITRTWQEHEFSLLGYKFHIPFVGYEVDTDADDNDGVDDAWLQDSTMQNSRQQREEQPKVAEHELLGDHQVDPVANIFKLQCRNISITQFNEELMVQRNINYEQMQLLRVTVADAAGGDVSLKLQQYESLREFKWAQSALHDETLQRLFTKHTQSFESVETLDFSENELRCIQWAQPQAVRRLKVLQLSGNHLVNCSLAELQYMNHLLELHLNANQLQTLPAHFLHQLSELRLLNLSDNALQELPRNIFEGALQLERLHLAKNRLSVLPFQLFQTARELRLLDLSENRLLSFPENFFTLNKQLRHLKLQNNRLQSISKHSFYNLRELRHLDLSQNELNSINRKAFESLENLLVLNISGNRLTQLSSITFQPLNVLRQLDLSRNQFKQLPDGLFQRQRKLVMLRIDETPLEQLPNWISRSEDYVDSQILQRLRYLSIQQNTRLTQLPETLFANVRNVRELLLADNSLLKLPTQIGSLSRLRRLSVRGNRLSSLPESLKDLTQLDYLNILGNEYICDCSLYWLSGWLSNSTIPLRRLPSTVGDALTAYDHIDNQIDELKCQYGYPGDMLRVLSNLNCSVPIVMQSSEPKMYRLHATAKLECMVYGSPTPDIIWVS